MSYIDEICGYLLQRGYVTREEVSTLMQRFGDLPELLDENDDVADEWPEEEMEPYSGYDEDSAGGRKVGSKRKGGRFGGHRTSGGNKVKVTAPELDAKLPALNWGAKLTQFLVLLQWLGGTGRKASEWSWGAFVKETDKFYEMGQDGLTKALKEKVAANPGKSHLSLLVLYSGHQWLVPPDALDGYVGPVVGVFNSEMGDFRVTEWIVNKHSWIYRHPNIRTMRRAVIVYNRLRQALVHYMKDSVISDLYLVVNLTTWDVRHSTTPPDLNDDTCRTTELWLRKIPRGSFAMGSPERETGRDDDEIVHNVKLTQDFYIGVFQCTQKQWEMVMGDNPSTYKGDCRPVERVSYDKIRGEEAGADWPEDGHALDSSSFMGRLRERTGLVFDLPTSAQWEYACRAGTKTALNSGKNLISTVSDKNMDEVGRYDGNKFDGIGGYKGAHTKVGCYRSNDWGLYDMHGNVWEWCLDWYDDNEKTSATDPVGAETGYFRVLRGGSWDDYAVYCRSAWCDTRFSGESDTDIGFRVTLIPVQGRK